MNNLRLATVLALLLAACGGGSKDPAADECDALFDLVCDRFAECQFMGVTSASACRNEINMSVDCDDADQVSATYDQCVDTMTTITCPDLEALGALPTECNSVILFEQ